MTARISPGPLSFDLCAEVPVANPSQMLTSPPLRVHESPPSPDPSSPTIAEAARQHERPADPPRHESTSSHDDADKRALLTPERHDASAVGPALPVPATALGPQQPTAKQLSEELNPEAILQFGEIFHTSAGQITGALGRCERLLACVIDKQSRLLGSLGTLTEQVVKQLAVVTELRELGDSLVGAPVPMSTQRAPPPERHLSLVAGRPDVLADIRDDLDNDDDA